MKKIFLLIATFTLSLNLFAKDLIVVNPEIKVLPTKSTTAATMTIKNTSKIDYKLVRVEGNFAKTFEMHTMGKVDGMMKMRKLDNIEIKANSEVELKSGGMHLMIFELNDLLKENSEYEIKLHFEPKKEEVVKFKAVAL